MTKWIKTVDGVVDVIAFEQPGHFETEKYQEEVSREEPVLDDNGKPILDENEKPVTVTIKVMEDRQRQVFVPDETFVEGPDDVFAGFAFDGKDYTAPKSPAPTSADVNAEMQRRVTLGFMFNGKQFDYTMEAKTNISGAAQMAFMAIVANPAAAKSFQWNGEPEEFQWCTYDNSFMPMTGEMVIAFGQTAAGHEHAHKKAVWKLKDMPEIPEDFKDDKYWPTLDTRL